MPICEANYALSQGSTIINLYEAWTFEKSSDIFFHFFTVVSWFVNLLKCPEDADIEELTRYCKMLDDQMGYFEHMKLDPNQCTPDPWLKQLIKVNKFLRLISIFDFEIRF